MNRPVKKRELVHLARPGAEFQLRVTPGARRNEITPAEDGSLKVQVTAAPEGGKANEAIIKLLAQALGVAKSRLTLLRGHQSRDKTLRLD